MRFGKKDKTKCLVVGIYLLAIALLTHTARDIYYEWWPLDSWFYYYSIKPVKPVYLVGEPLIFVADFETHKESSMVYYDDLQCRRAPKAQLHSVSYRTKYNPIQRETSRMTAEFELDYVTRSPMECYLHSTIGVRLPNGSIRTQDLEEQHIFIVAPNEQ